MHLPSTRALLPRVEWRESSPSTNAELRELFAAEPGLPHGTLLATTWQTAGRGRLDRGWETPPGQAVAVSVLLRGIAEPPIGGAGSAAAPTGTAVRAAAPLGPGWLPLLAGSAVTAALQARYPADSGMRVGVKWPNDVHVRSEEEAELGLVGGKLCGILCELLPGGGDDGFAGASVIVGMGMNLLIPEEELPTGRATSLLASGADVGGAATLVDPVGEALLDEVLAATAGGLLELAALAAGDPGAARTRVLRHSLTLGSEVRVHLPGGRIVDGRARTLADDGSLVLDLPTGGALTVAAGDVEHLR